MSQGALPLPSFRDSDWQRIHLNIPVHDHHGEGKAHGESHIGPYSVCPEVTYVTFTHISEAKTSPGATPHSKGAKEVQSYRVAII